MDKVMLINKTAVRQYILDRAAAARPGWDCDRVAEEVYRLLNEKIMAMLDRGVHQHPSTGKTFKELL